MVAEIAGERRHVVGGVGEAEDVFTDEVAGGRVAEADHKSVGFNDGKLFDYVPIQVCPCTFCRATKSRNMKLLRFAVRTHCISQSIRR